VAFPYYKAVRVGNEHDVKRIGSFRCPRVLADAFVPGKPGGTGKTVSTQLIESIRSRYALWLAGGIGPENVAGIVSSFRPELIDASSRLESEPGIKDRNKMALFFNEIERVSA
jgi:indole-3-glycerol phosphate synthase/phosphoribosylanthranilate isomerase